MKIVPLDVPGVMLLQTEPNADERGFFARTWCARELGALGIDVVVAQCSVSHSKRRGTVRGLHYQAKPHEETKFVTCIAGSVFDVVVDLRPESRTYLKWVAVELRAVRFASVLVPKGCAHGFQTLEDDTVLWYQISEFHHPEASRGVRWDDPALAIPWPLPCAVISARDRQFPTVPRSSED